MENKPKISIITITYNSERTLEETIKSVISQDYDNLEYLIIDGGSTDKTLEIVEKYQDQISFVLSEPDNGISDAFNKGIKNATGEIIGIINSDDFLLPDALKTIARNYDLSVDVYRGNTIRWEEKTGEKNSVIPRMSFAVNSLKFGSVCHQSTFVNRGAYDNYGTFDENLKFMMDVDLLTRFYEKGAIFKYIKKDLAISRSGGVTDRHSFWKKKKEVYEIVVNNGGSTLTACLKTTKFIIVQLVKKIIINMGVRQ